MSRAIERSIEGIVRVEPEGEDRFRATLSGFGAVTLAASVLAAGTTVEAKSLHSLHACFLRPVAADQPARIDVARPSDGRRIARRRVAVSSGGRLACEAMMSFAAAREGFTFQESRFDPDTPEPDDLPTFEEVHRSEGWEVDDSPIDWRWIGRPWDPEPGAASRYAAWVRPMRALPDDEATHAAALAYLADYHSHWPVARKLGAHFEPIHFTSLDQTLWFHRPPRWDDWCLLTSEAPIGHGGRSIGHRTLHDRNGQLLATMCQESLIPDESATA